MLLHRSCVALAGLAAGVLLALPAWSAPSAPLVLTGRITRVSDGDTVWLRPAEGGKPVQVRIDGIDAPELCQPGGPEAARALAQRVQGRTVQATLHAQDDYQRWLGRLALDDVDLGAWMVRQGHAWSYRFRHGAGPYQALEAEARAARRGLFAAADPMPPDVFRRWHGPCGPGAQVPVRQER